MVRTTDGSPIGKVAAAAICTFADGLRSQLVSSAPAIDLADAERLLRAPTSPTPANPRRRAN